MLYRVILTRNGEYKKTMHRCKTRKTVFINFNKIKDSNNIIFKREFINYKKIKPVKYKIYAVKDYEPTDESRVIRNNLGKLIKEPPIFGIWTVLNDSDYDMEESFLVYKHNHNYERKDIKYITKLLMLGIHDKFKTKEVIVVHNKLIIYNEDQFDMVICKCLKDAQRLHHVLNKAIIANKIKNIYFMGTAKRSMISNLYILIHNHTNWPYTKIRRTTTRP